MRVPRLPALLAAPALLLAACDDEDATASDDAGAGPAAAAELPPGEGWGTTPGDTGIEVPLRDVDGEELGAVTLRETSDGVLVEAVLRGLGDGGLHAFQLHEHPRCDPEDADGPFHGAGEAWNPDDAELGAQAGELPPLLVTSTGTASMLVRTDRFTFADLTAADGVAVVVHAERDDLGEAGERLACGELDAGALAADGGTSAWDDGPAPEQTDPGPDPATEDGADIGADPDDEGPQDEAGDDPETDEEGDGEG